jgi:tetratricopeptide (TPR) repeat protein
MLTLVLLGLIGIYVGYIEVEPTVLADQFGPTPTPTRPAVLYLADGDIHFSEGRLTEAIEAYEQAMQRDPNNDQAFIRQSRLLVYTRQTAKAVDRAAQAVQLNPSPENLAYYCRALDWEARYGEAFDACACATELDPAYAEAYAFMSEIYADQGNWTSAKSLAQEAIGHNYQSMDAHHNMGYALEVQGRYSEAAEYYENAITLMPQLAPLYVDAGRTYYWLSNYDRAMDRFRKAIRLNPGDPEAYNWLGWTFYTIGEYAQAIDALEQSISVDPTFTSSSRGTSAWGNLATVYYTRQNFEEASKILPKAIELAERNFVRRVRHLEISTEIDSLTGPEPLPILRGTFIDLNNRNRTTEMVPLIPIRYQASREVDREQSCTAAIIRNITQETPLFNPAQSLSVTQRFSQTTGTASIDLSSGMLSVQLNQLPPEAGLPPYEIKVTFWPNRTDSIGFVQPDPQGNVQVNIQFEEKLSAPIEYYYELGLAFAYLDPPQCDKAVPWLLKSLDLDSSGTNPAWAGLRICPTSSSPPTPVPTFTPIPTPSQ